MTGSERREPTLDDLLDEPIVQLLMRRDSVKRDEVVAMVEAIRRNRRSTGDRMAA
jgi:hypothetical protein